MKSSTSEHAPTEIALDSCAESEWIVVRTKHSVYELVVLSGKHGAVLVRGGRLFPTFQRATVAGSVIGPAAVRLASIVIGLHLELRVGTHSFVTSRIEAVSKGS